MKHLLTAALAWLAALGSAYAEPLKLTFDDQSTFFINRVQERDEPLIPGEAQRGPEFVATGRPFYDVREDGVYDHGFTVAPGTQYQFGIESSCRRTAGTETCQRDNSLRIALFGSEDTLEANVQDKAFMRLKPLDDTMTFLNPEEASDTLRLTFDIKFDRFYEKPKRWTMHMQIYQPGCGPALSLQMVRQNDETEGTRAAEQPLEMSLIGLRNRWPGAAPPPQPSPRHVTIRAYEVLDMCPPLPVERNQWYSIALEATPGAGADPDGVERGHVTLHIDGEPVCSFQGNWGIAERASGGACTPGSVVDIGVYRSRFRAFQAVHFDNVKLSFSSSKRDAGK